jgi:hypothetical protein
MVAHSQPSPNGIVAGPHDVLLGRGGGTNNHSGNKNFRDLVNAHKRRYLACSKVDKPKVAREVVEVWRKLDPPGRFLQRLSDPKSLDPPIFQEVSEKKAREKASQCLRERTPDVLPYLNQYHQEQNQFTEEGVGMVQLKIQMTGKNEAAAAAAAGADMPDQPVSSMSSHSHSSPPMVRRTSTPTVSDLQGQASKQDLELQQLYARQQQVLREAYTADDPQKAHQDAIHVAHQQALQERQVLEQQRQMLMQQQLAMQKQMIQNNLMAQHLMMTQNGLAMAAAGMPSPVASPGARRQSLNTGLSTLAITMPAVSPSPHTPQNGLHHRNPNMASHMMANNIPADPLDTSGHMPQSYAPIPEHAGSGIETSLIPLSDDSARGTRLRTLPLTDDKGKKLQPSPPSGTKDSTVPRVIATNSNDEVADLMKLPLDGANETPKKDNTGGSKSNMGGQLDDSGSTFQEYTTNLNDFAGVAGDHEFTDPNAYFEDDSSEELLNDVSKFHDSVNSNGSGDFSLTRKKKGAASRASAMSIGTASFMSLSAMEYSADLSREQKMSATPSNGSNRSMMSELTDYEQLHL